MPTSSFLQLQLLYGIYPPLSVEEIKTSTKSCLKLKPNPSPDILWSCRDVHGREFFASYSPDLSPQYYVYPPSFLAKQGYHFTGATGNGLLHFHHQSPASHVLWTGEYKILPEPPFPAHACLGYAMWSDNQDCKVMHLPDTIPSDDSDMFYHIGLYSLKTNSWRLIPCPDFDLIAIMDRRSAYACVSGVFYCVVHQECSGYCILAFDISTETVSITRR
ncbi:hypothetical protein SASPL_144560 [Salvia splendens]|uniref:F-box associated beta-propeller type 1 domain-containing protein n=1 Tax=Salvia splendens TaxID=180675 RepID=A0A8X8WH77_SALSN|nr:hypothetical protein SASPL_144560 [Salvia splendens]